jgi:predicted N-formylglutamate amidohydrolase
MNGLKLKPLITCEHAGNTVPSNYAHLFDGKEEVLLSHRGWDPGAVQVAEMLSRKLSAPYYICETTRLLVEPNRSLHSESLFSEFSRSLNENEKDQVLKEFYHPHRNAVEEFIRVSPNPILHLSIHSFTPVWNGIERDVDLGLLFDPERTNEAAFCEMCRDRLFHSLGGINIKFNEPYKGIDDGFTTYLRMRFDNDHYLGIEIEINQRFVGSETMERVARELSTSLRTLVLV